MTYKFSKEFKESNFTVEEFERSYISKKKGYDNTIPDSLKPNLERLVLTTIQPLRNALSKTLGKDTVLKISSGYRCESLNSDKKVGGSKTSKHLTCEAADLQTVVDPCILLIILITNKIPYTKAIIERIKLKDGTIKKWLHVTYTGIDSRINYITTDKINYTKV